MGGLIDAATLVAVVFALNVIPAFAPPTWMALSWVGFSRPSLNPFVVAALGALAATAGRVVLARLAGVIRRRWLSAALRDNIDEIRTSLERHRTLTFGGFMLYAFGPFPSNYLFIAYGLTALPLWLAAIPFCIGRFVSYSFFVFTAAEISQRLAAEASETQEYFGVYFVVSQLLLLGLVVVLARVDWHHLRMTKRFRWLRASKARASDEERG